MMAAYHINVQLSKPDLLLACLLVVALATPGTAADWPAFRGDGSGASAERNLPATFDPATNENIAWKVELPGRGPSSPIVIGNRVILAAASGAKQERLQVLCFDSQDGRLQWRRQFRATGHTVVNPFGGVAAPTPASDGRLVCAYFSSNDLVCLDLEGNVKWFRGLAYESPQTRNDVGMASSPVIIGDTVIVQAENQGDSFVMALDLASGETRWRQPREPTAVWSSPTVLRGKDRSGDLVLLNGRQKLTAIEPRSGDLVWQYEASCHTIASATTDGDRVFLPAIGLHALGYDRQKRTVTKLWYEERLRSDNSSPVVAGDRVYVLKPPGILLSADAADGRILWQLRLKGPFWATPVVADDRAYCVNHAGLVQIVALGDEGKLLGTAQIDEGVLASPAVAGGAIFLRTDQRLWKIAMQK